MSETQKVRSKKARESTAIPKGSPYNGPATTHLLNLGDARHLDWIADESVHLVVTSPPYFNLKEYNEHPNQLGSLDDYEQFLDELDAVWAHCHRVLIKGGRLVCNVGDVCVSRRANKGRHHVIPLHADISVRAREIGFDYLTPILWHKISNAKYEATGSGGGFLGKPYEPNAVIKNDVEYILMFRKPGGYRQPTLEQRSNSVLTKEEQSMWFQPIWNGLTGASTKTHPAPYPVELANRLVRMFSFAGDTVLDPFGGTGTTSLAALRVNRNSICNEVDFHYLQQARTRIESELGLELFREARPKLIVRQTATDRGH